MKTIAAQSRESVAAALALARVTAERDYEAFRVARWESDEAERTGGDVAIYAGAIVMDASQRAERSARRVVALEAQLDAVGRPALIERPTARRARRGGSRTLGRESHCAA